MRLTLRLGASVAVIGMVLVSCVANPSAENKTWGSDAVAYFDVLAQAYSDDDYYSVLDFYDVESSVEIWRGDNRGGMLVRNFLEWNSGDLGITIQGTYLGRDMAVTVVEWESSGALSAIHRDIAGGLITHEVIYDQGVWLEESLRSHSGLVARYEELYERYAEAWNGNDMAVIADLYEPGVTVTDPMFGEEIRGLEPLEATRGWSSNLASLELSSVTITGSRAAPAVFQGPSEFGVDPERAVALYEVTDSEGCVGQLGVVWRFADGLIVAEARLWGIGSFEECDRAMPEGWWSNIAPPGRSDERVTGTIRSEAGSVIAVHNGTPRLEQLVSSGLARFSAAGLTEPRFHSLTFEPSRECATRSGRLIQEDGAREVFLCLYESDLCPGEGKCVEPSLHVRSNVLHELGHAWIIDNVDGAAREQLLRVSGLEEWDSPDVPWEERGVEYAAEVLAWGLLEESAPMVRIGRPSCDELAMAFEILTGMASQARNEDCSD